MTHYMTFFLLLPLLLAPHAIAHDPVHTFCDLIAVPRPPQCDTTDCDAIINSNCSDNTCACGFTQQAQACVQCIASSDSVDKYNTYLNSCELLGLVAPTTTLPVYGTGTAAGLGEASTVAGAIDVQFTDIAASLAHDGQGGSTYPTTPMQPAADSYPQGQPATPAPGGGVGTSVYRGIASPAPAPAPSQPSIPAPLNGPSGNDAATNSTGLNTTADAGGIKVIPGTGSGSSASSQSPAANDSSTAALVASRNFFSSAISEACVRHCTSWKNQADLCNDDRCLCRGTTIHDAGVCSECVGDSGRGGTMGRCYSDFTQACQVQAVGTSASRPVANNMPAAGAGAAGAGTFTDIGAISNPALGLDDQPAVPAAAGTGYPTQPGRRPQPMLVTDSYGVTSTMLTTEIVTATAQAMIADETIIVTSGAGFTASLTRTTIVVGLGLHLVPDLLALFGI